MSTAMRPSYLGRILLHWCDRCHMPVLAERCHCGNATRPVPVMPAGAAKPVNWIRSCTGSGRDGGSVSRLSVSGSTSRCVAPRAGVSGKIRMCLPSAAPHRSTTGPHCTSGCISCGNERPTTLSMSVGWTGSDASCARPAIWH